MNLFSSRPCALCNITRPNRRPIKPPNKTRTYQLELAYDSIHNLTSKQQADVITQPSGTPVPQQKTSYAWTYAYAPSGPNSTRPHAPIHIGDRTYGYDANGNQTGWEHDDNGTRRHIVWDEENRIQSVFDNGHEKAYKYDDAGSRVIKRGPQGETVYLNPWYTIRDRGIATKHVWAGTSRLASRLVPGAASGGPPANGQASNSAHPGQGAAHRSDKARGSRRGFPGQGLAHRSASAGLHAQNTVQNPHFAGTAPPAATLPTRDNFLYYYHPDHLGSSTLVTDADGEVFEHLEYFPFGETWVEESSNTQRTPYRFTGKELDEETGLYYFGARYYDPRTSVWQSADVVMDRYLDGQLKGGVHNSANLAFYSYGYQNPIKNTDPNGKWVETGWDVFNVALGVKSFKDNYKQGNYWSAMLDAGGVLVDAAAVIVPGVPGGAGATIRAARTADTAVDALKTADKAEDVKKVVTVSRGKHPESAKHIEDAQTSGKPSVLTVGDPATKSARRKDAMAGHKPQAGKDRDEYPPAMFEEGGKGASVRKIEPSDNRGSGACIGNQCRGLSPGDKVEIKVVD